MTPHDALAVTYTSDHRGESWHLVMPTGEAVRLVVSARPGTWRGLHWEDAGPVKRVSCQHGRAFGVTLNPWTGRSTHVWLTGRSGGWVEVPVAWAWGWLALEPDTVVVYHFDAPLGNESVIYWNDPRLADVPWPIRPSIMSDRDTPPAA